MKIRLWVCLIGAAVLCGGINGTLADQIKLTPFAEGTMLLSCTGAVGAAYAIQATTNLASPAWATLAAAHTDANGQFNFIDRGATNYPSRFYQFVPLPAPPYRGALFAKGNISLSGGAFLNSYNSSVGSYGPTNVAANAAAVTDSTNAGAISVGGGCHIAGYAVTGPGGTCKVAGSGSVGDTNWIASQTGVEPGHFLNDANLQLNDVSVPPFGSYFTNFTTMGNTDVAGLPGMTTAYKVSSINEPAGKCLVVKGNVYIYCTQTGNNSVIISSTGYIQITPGSSLTLYLAGNFSNSGGGIVNENGLASFCQIYGLPGCTSFAYAGGSDFIGIVDAPEADLTLAGSESAFGIFLANSISLNGVAVHYDEALVSH